jgi:hypothetical protein
VGVVIAAAAACDDGDADGTDTPAAGDESIECPSVGEGWEVAKLYIEHNATDEDTGVHGSFGAEAGSVLCLTAPDGTRILTADPLEQFDRLAITAGTELIGTLRRAHRRVVA